MLITDTLHIEDKPQKLISEKAGCSLSAVLKHVYGKLTGREKCGRKRCISSSNDCSFEKMTQRFGRMEGMMLVSEHQETPSGIFLV